MAITIQINNDEVTTQAQSVQQLVAELALPDRGVALAVNNRVIMRAAWPDTPIAQGDKITIIKAAFGG